MSKDRAEKVHFRLGFLSLLDDIMDFNNEESLLTHLRRIGLVFASFALSLFMALFLGMMFSIFFLERTPTLAMMEASGVQRPLLMFVEIYVFYIVIRNFIALRSLKTSLSEGNPINHRERWRKAYYSAA